MTDGSGGGARRTKVAVVIGTLEVGGAELDIVRNFPRLNRDEFDVVVVCFASPGPLASELERQGIRVVARPHNASEVRGVRGGLGRAVGEAGRMLRVQRWLGRTLAAERVDVAHFFLPHSYVYGMVACLVWHRRAKRVMSRLSLNFYRDRVPAIAWLERTLMHRRVDIAIGNAKPILAELAEEGVDPCKLRLVHNGVDTTALAPSAGSRAAARAALGVEREAFVMAAIGNLHAYKGHGDLIEACALVRDELPAGWRLLVAGRDESGNLSAFGTRVEEVGLAEQIAFLGELDEIVSLLHAADVFVHPSHHEGLPNAVVEAMAAGLPVVASGVGGIPEAVCAGEPQAAGCEPTGWLVEPHDPASLGRALLESAADPSRRAAMGAAAARRAEAEFSIEASVSAYEAIYRELTGG